ncbi:Putative 2-aminoethylphosphonate transport system permease protein PhnV [Achromobacter insolitus]|uniref:ABC transporter permease n=1 Tax=Achromobacter insolitus TaxID=217204 RepID=UPI0014681988|nr:ABC transporter permease [Achromobacter insolitus]CAB3951372.1 Putative 2-aminoethylphosphonate transport system permease protein PhnV [Achromobacter insolitus]
MSIRKSLPLWLRIGAPVLITLILAFVLLPVVVVTLASFNEKALLTFPPQAWSWRWFERVFTYADFRDGFRASMVVTLWSSLLALVIGTGLAIAVKRMAFPGKNILQAILLSPLVIPHFTVGLGVLILAAQLNVDRGYGIVILCHVILVLPFVLRSVYVSMENLDERLEQSAASLGASPVRVLFTITVPLLAPGLFGGWLFAAIMSFSEFTASLFVTTQSTQTLPVTMYNYVREFADPTLAALSVVYIVVTAALLIFANRFLGLGRILNIEDNH